MLTGATLSLSIAALKLTVDAVLTGRVEVKLQQLVILAWRQRSAQISTSEVELRMLTAVFELGNCVEVLNLHNVAVIKDVGGGRAVGNGPFQWGLLAGASFFGFDVDRHLEAGEAQGSDTMSYQRGLRATQCHGQQLR